MKRILYTLLTPTLVTLAVAAAASAAPMSGMHPRLAAHLSGMGEHGAVDLQLSQHKQQVCWGFHLPMVAHITSAAVHVGLKGTTLFELGMHYARSGCERESAMTLAHLEASPGKYYVWVNTKGFPGDLRGRLFAGTAM